MAENKISNELTLELKQKLINEAKKAQENSYSPYSGFALGAAIYTEDGEIFTGCNIENISYGLTNCAERSAIFSMISHKGGKTKIKYLALTTKADIPCSPCGACRQVLAEFGPKAIIICKGENEYIEIPFSELLPNAFQEFVSLDQTGSAKRIQVDL